jgi:hypothetical protein
LHSYRDSLSTAIQAANDAWLPKEMSESGCNGQQCIETAQRLCQPCYLPEVVRTAIRQGTLRSLMKMLYKPCWETVGTLGENWLRRDYKGPALTNLCSDIRAF